MRDHHILIISVILMKVKWKLVFECIATISDSHSDPRLVMRNPEHASLLWAGQSFLSCFIRMKTLKFIRGEEFLCSTRMNCLQLMLGN